MEKGTFKGHLRKMFSQFYLWTSQINPSKFAEVIKKDICFSYDKLIFEELPSEKEDTKYFQMILDFGDMELEYIMVFRLSSLTKRWVLSAINM